MSDVRDNTPSDCHHFTQCGLPDVWVEGIEETVDEDGDAVVVIPRAEALHRLIIRAVIGRAGSLFGAEIRAIRTALGMTQADLGQLLHKEPLTVGRWERDEHPIDPNADTLLRLVANERLNLSLTLPVTGAAEARSTPRTDEPIIIRRADLDAFAMPSAA